MTLLFVVTFPWDTGLRRGLRRLIEALGARGHRVVSLEPSMPLGRRARPLVTTAPGAPGVTLITPGAVPGRRLGPVDAAGRAMERRALRRAWARLGLPSPDAVVVHPPGRAWAWELFPNALSVYRNHDYVDPTVARRMGDAADLVLTTSRRAARLGVFPADTTRFLSQSCDDHAPLATTVPDEPTAGTMGTIGRHADLQLLRTVVRGSPEVRFRFQGSFGDPLVPRELVLDALTAPNAEAHEVRQGHRGAVEAFLGSIRVGLCPYVLTTWTAFISPDRLLGFLRAGRPVVTTPFSDDALEPFRALPGVFVAGDADGFGSALPPALEAAGDPQVRAALVAGAEPYLAGHVAERFETLVAEALMR